MSFKKRSTQGDIAEYLNPYRRKEVRGWRLEARGWVTVRGVLL
jgi:hypothetical protein